MSIDLKQFLLAHPEVQNEVYEKGSSLSVSGTILTDMVIISKSAESSEIGMIAAVDAKEQMQSPTFWAEVDKCMALCNATTFAVMYVEEGVMATTFMTMTLAKEKE